MPEISIEEENSTTENNFDDAFKSYAAKLTADQVFDEPTVTERQDKSEYADAFASYKQEVQPQVQNLGNDVQYNLRTSMGKNPDMMSQVYNEADETNTPVPVVEANFEQIQQRKKVKDINPQKNPALARFISRKFNADVSHDDIDVLTEIEDHVRAYGSGAISLPQMITGGAAAGIEAGTRLTQKGLEKVLPDEWMDALNEIDQATVGYAPSDVLRAGEYSFKTAADYVKPDATGTSIEVAKALGQVTAQIGQMIIAPQTSFPSLFAQNISQQERKQIESGTEHTALADVGLITSGGYAVIERFGLEKLVNRVPTEIKNRVIKKLTDVVIGGGYEAATEVLENLGHSLTEYMTSNPDADFTKGVIEEAKIGGITGAIVRAIIPSYKGRGIKDPQTKQDIIENKTQTEQKHIDGLVSLLQKGKLSKRDAKAMLRFEEELPSDTAIKVDVEAFTDYEGEIPDFIQEQMDGMGSDLTVTMAQLGSEIVNDPALFQAVRPHMRMSDDTMTQAEVEAGGMTTVDNMMRDANEAAEKKIAIDEAAKGYVDQLVATGRMNTNDAKKSILGVTSYIESVANRRSIPVEEAIEVAGLRIEKLDPDAHDFGDEILEQEVVVKETGQKGKVREKKQVVYDQTIKQRDMVTKLRDCING